MCKIASIAYLIAGLVIGLGAFGHDSNARHIADEIGRSPAFDPGLRLVILAVWHFVSGCMLVFGAIVIHTWLRARRGERGIWFASDVLGAFYAIAGVATVVYTGRSFFWLFTVLGIVLLGCSAVLRSQPLANAASAQR